MTHVTTRPAVVGDPAGELPIHRVARLTGTTSRTLRHYDAVGLLRPSRVGHGGIRYYGADELVRLQRILVLRELGVGLKDIARALDGGAGDGGTGGDATVAALRDHLDQLRTQQRRLERQMRSVERTITAMTTGGPIMAEEMFDGFDHTQHEQEVRERWGDRAWESSDAWWRGMSDDERRAWLEHTGRLTQDWTAAAEAGTDPTSDEAQQLARRHVAWLAGIPGTPGEPGTAPDEYVLGLADMYVADPRFAASYGGEQGATFVRDALRHHIGNRG